MEGTGKQARCLWRVLPALLLSIVLATGASAPALAAVLDQSGLYGEDASAQELNEFASQENEVLVALEDDSPEEGEGELKAQVTPPEAVTGLTYNGTSQIGVYAGEGYRLQGAAGTNAGTYTAIASLADSETMVWDDGTTDPKEVSFTIGQASLAQASITLKWNSCTYKGDAKKPAVTSAIVVLDGTEVSLKKDTDYTVSYSNNVNAGTAKVTITGKGNFTGSASTDLTIKRASISKGTFELKWSSCTYKGDAKKPALKTAYVTVDGKDVNLKSGTDYSLSYKNNVNAGTATVTITGKGNYTDSVTKKLTIKPVDFKNVTCSVSAQLYTGKALKPNPKVTWNDTSLKKDTDYTLSYKDNTKVGKATVTVTGKGNFSGKQSLTFSIYQRKMSDATVASIGTQQYTGSDIKPNPKVTYKGKTLTKGTDYTVSYKNNRYGGTASVIITGKGSYKGSKTVKFKIDGPKYYGKTVYITNTGAKYHKSGCRYLKKSKHAVDLGVALYEGYDPCKVCKPPTK